jgi:hypothetical protein
MEIALYSFYSLVVEYHKTRLLVLYWILHNSWIKTVRAHRFPWRNLYLFNKRTSKYGLTKKRQTDPTLNLYSNMDYFLPIQAKH